MTGRKLGFTQIGGDSSGEESPFPVSTNTRSSLWPKRLPAIALEECIVKVETAPPHTRDAVKFALPCSTCDAAPRCLNAKAKELGPLLYGREILTNPSSSESTMFPRKLFKPMLRVGESLVPYWNPPFSMEYDYKVVQAWDIAWSEKIGGDYLVCATGYVRLSTGERQLLQLKRWQRLPFPQQCKLIELEHLTYRSDIVVIESDAAQRVWSQHLTAETNVPVLPHAAAGEGEHADKKDFARGVPGLLIKFANRKWRIPYTQGTPGYEEVENMLTEFEAFQWVDGSLEGVGEHDDTVLAFWHLDWGMDQAVYYASDVHQQHRGHVEGARG